MNFASLSVKQQQKCVAMAENQPPARSFIHSAQRVYRQQPTRNLSSPLAAAVFSLVCPPSLSTVI